MVGEKDFRNVFNEDMDLDEGKYMALHVMEQREPSDRYMNLSLFYLHM